MRRYRQAGDRRQRLRITIAAIAVALLSWPPAPALGDGDTDTPAIRISVSGELVARLLTAVVPYHIELDAGLFREVVTLTDPRRIRLVPGGLDLEMTATGSPVPFTAQVSPRVRLQQRPDGSWQIVVLELPASLGRLGTYDLSRFIDPVDVETVTPYLLETPGGLVPIDLVVQSIQVTPQDIQIGLGARFPALPPER